MATDEGRAKVRAGLLGVGLMGSAMAARMVDQGIEVLAWDRSAEHVRALAGVEVADTPGAVVVGTPTVITMLPTAEVVLAVVEPLLASWPDGTIWVQMSSVGASEADHLSEIAEQHGVTLVDAPVSGSTRPALEGRLTILASGRDSARQQLAPVFAALGQKVMWVGPAGMGSRLKLAANHWMIASITALAETMHLCEAMGLDQQELARLLDGGPLGSPYVIEKLGEMRRHEYPAGFPVRLALKDLELVHEVQASAGIHMPVLEAALDRFQAAAETLGDEDAAAVYEVQG